MWRLKWLKGEKKKNVIASRDVLGDLSRSRLEGFAQRHVSGASANHCSWSVKRFQPLSSFAWRRLQGERCAGESARRPVKPQERASWKLLVNTTGGNWHPPPAGQVCEHDFPYLRTFPEHFFFIVLTA